ncbi:hypothetical protein ALC53_05587 [Atta colombica]|uniref:Uncharacterized protein n=1 Tax=Atta colombica TaxID=520822 RepID=A0A151I3U2_9HYME|nr:hypothetical protein ALC53_05587 [Atta colombica]
MSLVLSTQFDNFRALGNVEKSSRDLHLSSKGTNIERVRSCEKVKIALMHSIHTQTAKTVCKLCKVICMIVSAAWSEDQGEKENRSQLRLRVQKTKLASFSRLSYEAIRSVLDAPRTCIDNVNKITKRQKNNLPSQDFLDNPNVGGSRLHPLQLLQSDSGSLLKLHSESSSKRSESSKEKLLPPARPPPPPPPPPLPEDRARLPASFNYRANQHTRKYERVLDGYLPPCPPRRISSARSCSGVDSTTVFLKTCVREKTTFHITIVLIATFQYNLHKTCFFFS